LLTPGTAAAEGQNPGIAAPGLGSHRHRSTELRNPSDKFCVVQGDSPMALCLSLSLLIRGINLGSFLLWLIGRVFLTLLSVSLRVDGVLDCDTSILSQSLALYLVLCKCLCMACFFPATVQLLLLSVCLSLGLDLPAN